MNNHITIYVEGGEVQEVYSTDPTIGVRIVNRDLPPELQVQDLQPIVPNWKGVETQEELTSFLLA